jgi:prepilin-type N-terminal cleavage/methylation domain-containing protein
MVRKRSAGFTVVELMIAITVFSAVITLVSAAVIQVGRMYQQGVTKTKILDASRELHQDFAQNVQYGADISSGVSDLDLGVDPFGDTKVWCAGITRYSWIPAKADSSNLAVAQDSFKVDTVAAFSDCTSTAIDAGAKKPLPKDTFVSVFTVTEASGAYTLNTRFAYGDADMFQGNDITKSCRTSVAGGEYCAAVDFSSTVIQKVK